MFKFVSSFNGKYCAMQEDNKITCNQDSEDKWTQEYQYKYLRLLFIGDNGTIVAIADDSVIKIYIDNCSSPEIIDCLSKKNLLELDVVLTNLDMNSNGTQLCFSTQSRAHNFAEGVQNFFTIPGAKKSLVIDRIHFYSLITGQKKDYYEHKSEYLGEQKFLWATSKDFFWIAIAEPEKKLGIIQTKISLTSVQEFTTYREEILKYNAKVKKIFVNVSGTIAVEVEDERGKATILMKYNERSERLEMKPTQTLDNLGMDYVSFRDTDDEIVIKTFDNYVKCYAPLKSLNEMKIPWSLQYIEKNEMMLLMKDKGIFSINRTSFDSLATDAKRWEFIKNSIFEAKEQNESPQVLYAPNRFNLTKQTQRRPIVITNTLAPVENNPIQPKKISIYAPTPIYKKPTSNRRLSLSLGNTSTNNDKKQNNNLDYSTPESFFGDIGNTETNYNQYDHDSNSQYEEQFNESNNEEFNYYSAITNEEEPKPQKQEYMHDMIRRISAERTKMQKRIDIHTQEVINVPSDDNQEKQNKVDRLSPEQIEKIKEEKKKINKLVSVLEERFIQGEISEETYKELKDKYIKKQMLIDKYSV